MACRIVLNGQKLGGPAIQIEGGLGELELLSVPSSFHGGEIGYAAWRAVERMQPEREALADPHTLF